MDAVLDLFLAEDTVRVAETRPGAGHHQHAVPGAQLIGDNVHGAHIAAVAGDQQKLAEAVERLPRARGGMLTMGGG